MLRWRVALVCAIASAAAACGRVGFDSRGAPADADPNAPDADPNAPDADPNAPDADPNAPDAGPAVCGDDTCTIAAGETCQSCTDCATSVAVCGNGVCNPGSGEDGMTCFDDCGVWNDTWISFETQLLSIINANRMTVFDCPQNQNMPAVPALALDAGLTALARDLAWDGTHHDYLPPNGVRCSGQDMFGLMNDAGYTGQRGYAYAYGFTAASEVANSMFSDATVCPMLKDGVYTMIGVGHADDAGPPWSVVTVH